LFKNDVNIYEKSTEAETLIGNESLSPILDEDQLNDYLNLKGQWNSELVTSFKLDL